jgi:hypothetical protein
VAKRRASASCAKRARAAGARPFKGETPYAVVSEILTAKVPSLAEAAPGVDPRLADLVARCLERDVDKRIPSASSILAVLGSLGTRPRADSLPGEAQAPAIQRAGTPFVDAPTVPAVGPAPPIGGPTKQTDPTHTSTAAVVQSWASGLSPRYAVLARLRADKRTIASAFERMNARTRIQVATAAGGSAGRTPVVVTPASLPAETPTLELDELPLEGTKPEKEELQEPRVRAPAPKPKAVPRTRPAPRPSPTPRSGIPESPW